jgi:hypothetical protein
MMQFQASAAADTSNMPATWATRGVDNGTLADEVDSHGPQCIGPQVDESVQVEPHR